MKFAQLSYQGQRAIAVVDTEKGQFWPVAELAPGFTGDMVQLVQQYETLKPKLAPAGAGKPLGEAKVLAPIDRPRRNIFCVGKNYHEHAAEFSKSGFDSSAKDGEHAPEAPVVFTKPASTVIGPNDKIPPHTVVAKQLDYEVELAVFIC